MVMKQILFWKYTDIAGQMLMLFPLICMVLSGDCGDAFYLYFMVGTWQAISCGVTAMTDIQPVTKSRRYYTKFLLCIIGLLLTCLWLFWSFNPEHLPDRSLPAGIRHFFGGAILLEALVMLFLGPVMAIWYALITLKEIGLLQEAVRHRAEIHWKL